MLVRGCAHRGRKRLWARIPVRDLKMSIARRSLEPVRATPCPASQCCHARRRKACNGNARLFISRVRHSPAEAVTTSTWGGAGGSVPARIPVLVYLSRTGSPSIFAGVTSSQDGRRRCQAQGGAHLRAMAGMQVAREAVQALADQTWAGTPRKPGRQKGPVDTGGCGGWPRVGTGGCGGWPWGRNGKLAGGRARLAQVAVEGGHGDKMGSWQVAGPLDRGGCGGWPCRAMQVGQEWT